MLLSHRSPRVSNNVLPHRGRNWGPERLYGLLELPPGAENSPEVPSALVSSWSPQATHARVAVNTLKLPSEVLDDVRAPPRDNASTQLSCPGDALPMASPGFFAKPPLSLRL